MQIKVLGPLNARVAGVSIVPTAAKVRQVLAMLALNAGQVVTARALTEELWEDAPRSAATTLQTYILQLRRNLGGALDGVSERRAKDVLVTRHVGYVLDVDPSCVDATAFEVLTSAGRSAFDLGHYESASRILTTALDLWRGDALVDITPGPLLAIEVLRLEEDRLGALECRIDAELILGRHHGLLTELTALTARHPMNENLHSRYLLALYRSGRQGQAFDAYARIRRNLIEELGVEPSGRLRRLHLDMLNTDPALDSPHGSVASLHGRVTTSFEGAALGA
ncbi:MAG TPA: AfsR/SARP family transcriptional regulator [Dermatophilaceae bacterium]|nr:AfsR/SARP family transcriptional regulator [Dermatophilaceae bacterium]